MTYSFRKTPRQVWKPLRYVEMITSQEELGQRSEMIHRMGRRLERWRAQQARAWVGDPAKTRQKRAQILAGLGYRPAPVPLRPRLLREEKLPHCRRLTYRLQINPDDRTEAYLLLPHHASAKHPVPGLVGIHEHGGNFLLGKEKLTLDPTLSKPLRKYQQSCYGSQLPADFFAAHGYAVLTIDQLTFGSRALWREDETPAQVFRTATERQVLDLRLRMRSDGYRLHRALLAFGHTEAEIALYDNRRSLDFLQSLPEVDAERLGCFGLSLGSILTHHLAALDGRVRAAVPVCWSADMARMIDEDGPRNLAVQFLLPGASSELHVPEFVALSDPCAVLILNGRQDRLYSFEAQERARRAVERYRKLQRRQRSVRWSYFDGPHCFLAEQQREALAFFDAVLKGTN